MAQGYFNEDRIEEQATFELFFRSNPFDGGYTVLAGIEEAIAYLDQFSFDRSDINYLQSLDMFTPDFLDYLADLQFEGEVEGLPEGSVIFPYEPILQITGRLPVVQILESALLNLINYPCLIATKAARIKYSTRRKETVLEFGLRRAQGDGAIPGARAAVIGGCAGTSNTLAGKIYGLPISGTQAHSWIQSFDDELEAFRSYARTFPTNTVLLVDTYDTLHSGVPNAIQVAKEMEARSQSLRGIRIDSGDLAWLSIQAAEMLDKADLPDVKIVLSSDLDEYVVESIVNQISSRMQDKQDQEFTQRLLGRLLWGVGTKLITGSGGEKAALGGVYKLVEIAGKPVIKISENRAKTTNPGRKQLWRLKSKKGRWIADVMGLYGEPAPQAGDRIYHLSDSTKFLTLDEVEVEPLHHNLLEYYNQDRTKEEVWKEAKNRAHHLVFEELDESHLRFLNPHIYKVSLTSKLFGLKQEFLTKHKKS